LLKFLLKNPLNQNPLIENNEEPQRNEKGDRLYIIKDSE